MVKTFITTGRSNQFEKQPDLKTKEDGAGREKINEFRIFGISNFSPAVTEYGDVNSYCFTINGVPENMLTFKVTVYLQNKFRFFSIKVMIQMKFLT